MNGTVNSLAWRIVNHLGVAEVSLIARTLQVQGYTRMIAVAGCPDFRRVGLLEIAALLHGVVCPPARVRSAEALPYREKEGETAARRWLADYPGLNAAEVSFIARAAGAHRQYKTARRLGFEPLFEAVLAVDFLEGREPCEQLPECRKMVTTVAGRSLFETLFPAGE